MTRRRHLPAPLNGRPFTVAEARELGVPHHRLCASDLVAPHHGLRAPGGPTDDVVTRAARLAPALRSWQYFSHTTAAAIWGIPLPTEHRSAPALLHVTSVGARNPMRRPGVVGHRVHGAETAVVRGLPVSDPLRTWLALADLLDVVGLVIAGDALVGRQLDLVRLDDLREAAESRANPHRARRIREAAAQIRIGAESPKESEVRLALPPHLLAAVELNVTVFQDGEMIGRADLVFADAMVTVEYEGDHHRTDRTTFRNDVRRRRRFGDAGWHVVQVTQLDLDNGPAAFVRELERLLRARAGRGAHLRHQFRADRLEAVWG